LPERATYVEPDAIMGSPTCADLFSGAGGLSLGFCQSGGLPVAAVDHDPDSMATYGRMFPEGIDIHCGPIEGWIPRIETGSLTVAIGGPPCQGFSLARGLRFVDDPRNHLYRHFVRFLADFSPRWFVMENVPGITSIGRGLLLHQIFEDFRAIGYSVECRVINMADYGIPQMRRRAIFVGNRVNAHFAWPIATHAKAEPNVLTLLPGAEPYLSIRDALGDLPWSLGEYFAHRANSQMRGPRNRRVDRDPAFTLRVRGDEFALCDTPATGAFAPGPMPSERLTYSEPLNWFQDDMREEPPPWIQPDKKAATRRRRPPRLTGTRRLSLRELARLQTFPDWFGFSGVPSSQARQIGNAVPPLFARQLFRAILASDQAKRIESELGGIQQSADNHIEVFGA
jgi:DNA (cytosine-5)-methyltransferase 1